jgi:hypothetical protein
MRLARSFWVCVVVKGGVATTTASRLSRLSMRSLQFQMCTHPAPASASLLWTPEDLTDSCVDGCAHVAQGLLQQRVVARKVFGDGVEALQLLQLLVNLAVVCLDILSKCVGAWV